MVCINKQKIVKTIDNKRNAIYERIKNLEYCIVTLFDEDNKFLARGINWIGESEYGDYVDFNKKFTNQELSYLTINTIDKWLMADIAVLEGPDGIKITVSL